MIEIYFVLKLQLFSYKRKGLLVSTVKENRLINNKVLDSFLLYKDLINK